MKHDKFGQGFADFSAPVPIGSKAAYFGGYNVPSIQAINLMSNEDINDFDFDKVDEADITTLYREVEAAHYGFCRFLLCTFSEVVEHSTPPAKVLKFLMLLQNSIQDNPVLCDHLQITIKRFSRQ